LPIDHDILDGLNNWKNNVTDKQIEHFQGLLPQLRTGLLTFLEKYDAVISPVTATPAVKHATTFDDIHRLVFVQLPAYVPAIPAGTVRCGVSKGSKNTKPLPIGVQVIGRQYREDMVLALMGVLEQERGGWRRPPL